MVTDSVLVELGNIPNIGTCSSYNNGNGIGTGPDEQTREAQKQKLDMGCDLKEEKESMEKKILATHKNQVQGLKT